MWMKTYRIMNLKTHKWWEGEAHCPRCAAVKSGFPNADCWIRVKTNAGAGGWARTEPKGSTPVEPTGELWGERREV